MIPRLKPHFQLRDLRCIWPSFNSTKNIKDFEKAFAKIAGVEHAIAFPYGRTAQFAILRALSSNGSEIICPSYTCIVVPHAIIKAGFKPVFVDSNSDDFNMNWELVENAITPNTGAIIATSIFGHPTNGEAFQRFIARNPQIPIIQDCAHSFFANDAHKDGICAFYGLNVSKIITSIFGGMVTTNSSDFAEKIRFIRSQILVKKSVYDELKRVLYFIAVLTAFSKPIYGIVNRLERLNLLNYFVKYYDPNKIDLPLDAFKEISGVEARVGLEQTKRYEVIVAHRKKIAKIYRERLVGVGDLTLPPFHEKMTVSHYVLRTNFAATLIKKCLSQGVQLGELIDYDCSKMPTYLGMKVHNNGVSEAFPTKVINLPVHKDVSEAKAIRITKIITQSFQKINIK